MYKVRAGNEAGSSDTPWVIGTTREAPPYGILAPYQATALSGYAIGTHLLLFPLDICFC